MSAPQYCQYEGGVANTLGLPLLLLVESDLVGRGIFDLGAGLRIARFPQNADRRWLQENTFRAPFAEWRKQLERRRDVFLGYASSSEGTARNIKRFMEKEVGATVLDWKSDFSAGGTILEQIQEAVDRCSGGVFLFTRDDVLQGETEQAAPRDNVVFEAGFFAHARGKERVLIVRERSAKMPADLGGNIYATLEDRSNITPIEDQLRRFLEQRL